MVPNNSPHRFLILICLAPSVIFLPRSAHKYWKQENVITVIVHHMPKFSVYKIFEFHLNNKTGLSKHNIYFFNYLFNDLLSYIICRGLSEVDPFFQNKIIIILCLAIMETKNDMPHENMLWNRDNSELGMS